MQILMSAKRELMRVMRMQSAVTLRGVMSVNVEMGSLEKEHTAMVSTTIIIIIVICYQVTCVDIDIYTCDTISLLYIVV